MDTWSPTTWQLCCPTSARGIRRLPSCMTISRGAGARLDGRRWDVRGMGDDAMTTFDLQIVANQVRGARNLGDRRLQAHVSDEDDAVFDRRSVEPRNKRSSPAGKPTLAAGRPMMTHGHDRPGRREHHDHFGGFHPTLLNLPDVHGSDRLQGRCRAPTDGGSVAHDELREHVVLGVVSAQQARGDAGLPRIPEIGAGCG